jgi:tRNA U34 5-methylaminomethyl-2-thiouridine-forming methyltransferase MnmC
MMELVRTEDGSISKFDATTGELYHNRAGAFTEALRNYFEPSDAAARLRSRQSLRIIDACFGLGYNTFVLLEKLIELGLAGRIEVEAVELDPEIIGALPDVLEDARFSALRAAFGTQRPSQFQQYEFTAGSLTVSLEIMQADLRDYARELTGAFDLVFHDPFSPRKVPHLWSIDLFSRYYQALLGAGGQLLTYSAASAVRGGLREAGFAVFRTQGVGAKSGGTLASAKPDYKAIEPVFDLTDEVVKKLGGTAGVPYRDSGLCSLDSDILARRAQEQGLA